MAENAIDHGTKKPDLGVRFVHGIGEQRQGDTLVQLADPLSSWVVRLLSRDPS